jgi:hypothetical protein
MGNGVWAGTTKVVDCIGGPCRDRTYGRHTLSFPSESALMTLMDSIAARSVILLISGEKVAVFSFGLDLNVHLRAVSQRIVHGRKFG